MRWLASLLMILMALPAGASGVLRLRSQTGVEVVWEGVALGETDAGGLMVVEGIPPGEYRVTLRKPGFQTLDVQIPVADGASVTHAIRLEPIGAGVRATAPRPAADTGGGILAGEPVAPAEEPAQKPVGEPAQKPVGEPAQEPTEKPVEKPAGEAGAGLSPAASAPVASTSAGGRSSESLGEASRPAVGLALGTFLSSTPGAAALALGLLAGIVAVIWLLRSRGAPPHPGLPPAPGMPGEDEEPPVFDPEADRGAPGFLEDLKRREKHLDEAPATPRPEETIIEVEAIEVRPADEP